MELTLLYFAWVREHIGTGQEQVAVPPQVTTVEDLRSWLIGRSPGHALALADPGRLRAAIDDRFVPLDVPLGTACEVSFFPPVTGG